MNNKYIIKKIDYDDIEEIDNASDSSGLVSEIKNTKTTIDYIINLDESIDSPNYYREVYSVLRKAKSDSKIIFQINSYGGSVDSFIQLYNSIMDTKAKTKAEIYTAYSAGAMIALSCDEIEVKEFSSMMIHDMGWASSGKISEIVVHSGFMDNWNKQIAEKIFYRFLSKKEIEDILNGKDIWLTSEEIKCKLKNWVPIRKRSSK